MAFNIKPTLQAVQSYLAKSGYFETAQIGEPKQPPTGRLTAAIWMQSTRVAAVTLTTTIESHVVMIRIYRDMLAEPQADIETDLADAVSRISSDLLGEYDLGATVRNIDVGGQYGTPLGAEWGYVDISGKMFRIVDITLPLTVDDSATLAP